MALVEIKDHERVAMLNTVIIMRSVAKTLDKGDRTHAQRLRIWAQMVEDVVERMEADMLGAKP